MKVMYVLFILLFIVSTCTSKHEALKGHQIWEVLKSEQHTLQSLQHDAYVDILGSRDQFMTLRIEPQHLYKVKEVLDKKKINFNVVHEDVAEHLRSIDKESNSVSRSDEVCASGNCEKPFLSNYMSFDQITWYLKDISSKFDFVSLEILGKSIEDRDMMMIHIKAKNPDKNMKKIWIEAGIHAREWISPAVALNIIHNLVSDSTMRENVEYYGVPVMNPDGYVYSHTTNRLWRKNRRKVGNDQECNGVDLNRNWGHMWGKHGSSGNACGQTYRGSKAFSEPETDTLQKKMTSIDNLSMTLFFHSYGQYFLFPWGYTLDTDGSFPKMMEMGKTFAKEVKKRHGTLYTVGQSSETLYTVSGASGDWAKHQLNITYTQTIELRDHGSFGFVLPAEQIKATVEETYDGFKAMIKRVKSEIIHNKHSVKKETM